MTDMSLQSQLRRQQLRRLPTTAATATGTQSLGKQDFLKLLMAQLQNQDPMKPMDDTR